MSIIISVVVAIVLVFGIQFLAPFLPLNELLGGHFYQVVSVLLAIFVSILLNLPMLYMFKGNSAYGKGKIKEALELYKKALKTKKLSVDMEIYCGYILLKEGQKEECEKVFDALYKKTLTQRQKNSLDTNMALLLWKKGQVEDGVKLLEKVWEKEPSITVAGSLGALMLIEAKKTENYENVVKFCEKTNEKYTYEKTIMANLGEAYYCTGRNDDALKIFEELMDCGTQSPAPYYYYGLTLAKAGQFGEARDMFSKALRQRFSALSTVSKKTVKEALEEITKEN